jgi:multidrug efflux pump subunit AcrA (membrane-fusion protein)
VPACWSRREEIQGRATEQLGRRFRDYDITCVAVLIGRPESQLDAAHKGQDPIQSLYDQLRQRRLAAEQVETYARQQEAAAKQRELNEARAAADKQTELTQTTVDVAIAANRGEAQLAEARRLAERDATRADGEARSRELLGRGEASRIAQTGLAEAGVFLKKIRAYGDPRLFALNLMAEQMAHSQQPLVPERMLLMGRDGQAAEGGLGLFGPLLAMLLAEKSGFDLEGTASGGASLRDLERFVEGFAGAKATEGVATGATEEQG